jgi:3-oxoacyl-[acyl-carrier protein] reductase
MDFSNKIALITGSGSGIGKALALMLADMGAHIIINDVSEENGSQTVEEVTAKGRKAIFSNANVIEETQVKQMFETVTGTFGKLDILVNNAGITKDALLSEMSVEQWDQVMEVNLRGVFLCSKYAAAMMSEQKQGKIINISSATGLMGNVGQVNYAASKGGVVAITKTLAKELARFNINVNAVAPGYIRTPMTKTVPEKVENFLIKQIPLRRAGEAEEVANAIAFLASDMADYITGQVLSVNGGIYV